MAEPTGGPHLPPWWEMLIIAAIVCAFEYGLYWTFGEEFCKDRADAALAQE